MSTNASNDWPSTRALGRDDADDVEPLAAQMRISLPIGFTCLEQLVRHVVPDHHHGAPLRVVDIGERPPLSMR